MKYHGINELITTAVYQISGIIYFKLFLVYLSVHFFLILVNHCHLNLIVWDFFVNMRQLCF